VYGLDKLSDYEAEGLKAMMPELHSSIQKGMDFVKGA
jgi:malate dehydrogenase